MVVCEGGKRVGAGGIYRRLIALAQDGMARNLGGAKGDLAGASERCRFFNGWVLVRRQSVPRFGNLKLFQQRLALIRKSG